MRGRQIVVRVLAGLVGLLILGAGGGYLWASSATQGRLNQHFEGHRVDFPVPFPLTEAELIALRAEHAVPVPADAESAGGETQSAAPGRGEVPPAPADPLAGLDLDKLALERATARGKHLVEARYACLECHGADFAGGTMIDAPPIGKLLGRNLTQGKGSVTTKYTIADWDRIVRHGIKPDGTPAVMPSVDFFGMSDRELSDILA